MNKKGFTLIEMIATLAVLAILMTGIAMLVEPSVKVYVRSTDLSRGETICDDVLSLLSSEFAYASDIKFDTEWADSAQVEGAKNATYQSASYGEVSFGNTDEGIILLKLTDDSGKISYNKEFYMGNSLQIGLSKESTKVLHIDAALFDRNGQLIGNRDRYVRLLNTSL